MTFSMTNGADGARWRVGSLILCHFLAFFLWAGLLFDPAASLWAAVDRGAFFFLNGLIDWGGVWPRFWALANTKAFDVVNGGLMVLFGIWVFLIQKDEAGVPRPLARRFAEFITLCLVVAVGVIVSKEVFVATEKLAPSLVLQPFHDLSRLVPDISAKTGSTQSFPADHGVVAFIYAGYFLFVARRRDFWIAALIAVVNVTPRMVSGAHWLSDTLVGGGMFMLIFLSWALATPARAWAEQVSAAILKKFRAFFPGS